MKKSLIAVAVLGAFASTAMAADVTLYGKIDTGLNYTHVDTDVNGVDATDKVSMASGMNSGSRWGLKGTEELGNGLKVGFVLESGFNSDDGTMGTSGTIFNRESTLFVQGDFGKVLAGRMGTLVYGAGSVSKIGMLSAFGTSFNEYVPQVQSTMAFTGGRQDNAIAYESPKFAGVTVRAQYAFGKNGSENESSSDRYYAVSATYENGPVNVFFAVDSVNYQSFDAGATKDVDDSLTVTLGGNYDFDVARVYFGAQYFDEVLPKAFSGLDATTYGTAPSEKLTGYGLNASVSAPLVGGVAKFGVSYMDASEADSVKTGDFDLTRWQVAVGYDYALSKRTTVYGVASYGQDKYDVKANEDSQKPSYATVKIGLLHNF